MEKQQTFSHGLLYAVAPENFSTLHILEEERKDKFDWEAYQSQFNEDSIVKVVLTFLKVTAVTKP